MHSRERVRRQRVHAKRRANQRYGLELTTAEVESIVRKIQTSAAKPIRKISNQITEFEVTLKEEICRVVYDRRRHSIMTFLPPANQGATTELEGER